MPRLNNCYKSAVESAISSFGGTIHLKLVGTVYGLDYDDIENKIRENLLEFKYSTPRCTRKRAWDVNERLVQLEQFKSGILS